MTMKTELPNMPDLSHREETLAYLLDKLMFIKLVPKNILVLAQAKLKTKILSDLRILYPEAQCDFVSANLRDHTVKADHYDLILCHWLQPADLLAEDVTDNALSTYELLFYLLHHFLKKSGLLLFSYMGPETTLKNLNPEILALIQPPMPALGDILLKLDYQDPVLDRDCFTYEQGRLELAYGHAWKKAEERAYFSKPDETGTVFMPVSQIKHLETVD